MATATLSRPVTKKTTPASYVLSQLGTPPNLKTVKVSQVGVNGHRVNVFVTEGEGIMTTNKIAHSFMLRETPDGFVSDPPICKQYE